MQEAYWKEFSEFMDNKIPLNPPLQKGEAVGMPGLIEMLRDTLIIIVSWCLCGLIITIVYSIMEETHEPEKRTLRYIV